MNKYLALKGEDKFDISKITAVGSPTITSDGVASGFTADNYVTSGTFNATKPFRIEQECFCNGITTTQTAFQISNTTSSQFFLIYAKVDGVLEAYDGVNYLYSYFAQKIDFNKKFKIILVSDGTNLMLGWEQDGIEHFDETKKRPLSAFTAWAPVENAFVKIGTGTYLTKWVVGSIDLKEFKIYVDNQLVYSPTKPTYLSERRKLKVWDKEQFTIVGNPSISDEGVISNCSGSNYAKINNPITLVNNKFQVDCTIPIGTGVPFVIYIGTAAKTFFWRNANNKLRVVLRSTTTDLLDTTVDVPETSLNVKCIIENNTCLVNVNGETLINKTITANAFFEMLNSSDYFTFGSDIGNHPFNQPLDLKTFKIYTDNTLVFDGGKQKYLYDPSKFTVVGSPTITDDGVILSASKNNFINTGFNISNLLNKSWKIEGRWEYNGVNQNYNILASLAGHYVFFGGIAYRTTDFRLIFLGNFGDNDSNTGAETGITVYLNENPETIDYRLEFDITTGQYTLYYSLDGGAYLSKTYIPNTANKQLYNISVDNNRFLTIGGTTTDNFELGNKIDLKQFSITVDGKEVFTGAKVGFFVLRR